MSAAADSLFIALGKDVAERPAASATRAPAAEQAPYPYLVDPADVCDPLKGVEWSYAAGMAAGRRNRQRGSRQETLSDGRVRDLARLLAKYNGYARGFLSALLSYTLGDKGMQVEVI